VLRCPHVNKTSREHFWKLTKRFAFDWDAEFGVVSDEAEFDLVAALPQMLPPASPFTHPLF
jgi:hypothetical protein